MGSIYASLEARRRRVRCKAGPVSAGTCSLGACDGCFLFPRYDSLTVSAVMKQDDPIFFLVVFCSFLWYLCVQKRVRFSTGYGVGDFVDLDTFHSVHRRSDVSSFFLVVLLVAIHTYCTHIRTKSVSLVPCKAFSGVECPSDYAQRHKTCTTQMNPLLLSVVECPSDIVLPRVTAYSIQSS